MNTNKYTQKTLEALQSAQQLAIEYQNQALEPEHLLAATASQQDGLIPQLRAVSRTKSISRRPPTRCSPPPSTPPKA